MSRIKASDLLLFEEGLIDTMPVQIDPIEIEQVRTCRYKAKLCKECGKPQSNKVHRKKNVEEGLEFCHFKRQIGCLNCGKPKKDPSHLGAPESFNIFASGGWEQWQAAKARWHEVLVPLLTASGLPKGCKTIVVEGVCSFGDAQRHDQGNHRVVIEKALGDVLKEEGYLPDDTWAHYEFGGLAWNEDGRNWIRLLIMATMDGELTSG